MSLPGLAIAVHILSVLWWLGGVAFVTLVFLPALRSDYPGDPHVLLNAIESRFAPQARLAIILVGLSGGYLLVATGYWHLLLQGAFWWLDAMIAYWLLFVLMLFVIEPLGVMQRVIFNGRDAASSWRRFHVAHMILLALGVVVVAAVAAGNHGY